MYIGEEIRRGIIVPEPITMPETAPVPEPQRETVPVPVSVPETAPSVPVGIGA